MSFVAAISMAWSSHAQETGYCKKIAGKGEIILSNANFFNPSTMGSYTTGTKKGIIWLKGNRHPYIGEWSKADKNTAIAIWSIDGYRQAMEYDIREMNRCKEVRGKWVIY